MTLKNAVEFARMAEVIRQQTAGRTAAFFTNPGNLGDALIEAGSWAFLDACGIRYEIQNARKLRELHQRHYPLAYIKGRVLRVLSAGAYDKHPLSIADAARRHAVAILCGSGGFSPQAHVAKQIHEMCVDAFERVIVLPTTYSLAPRVTANSLFFARDRFESVAAVPGAVFCHDMALFLDPDQVAPVRKVGYHLRTDNESSGRLPLPIDNADVSAGGTELDPVQRMFAEVGRSEIIVTDRLHVCIAAALLGRRVYLFRGNYFKIESIFRSSLQGHYPNVILLDDWTRLPAGLRP